MKTQIYAQKISTKNKMENVWKAIKNFFVKAFKWIFSDFTHALLVLACVCVCILQFKYTYMKDKYYNLVDSTEDTIKVYKNKIGEIYKERASAITDIKNLKLKNEELYNEVKNLKENPIVVTKIKTEIKYKDIEVHDTVKIDPQGNYFFPVNHNDQWISINGKSSFDVSKMLGTVKFDSISVPNNITVDIIEKGDKLSFLAKTDNPYCQINSLNGTILSPEKSKVLKRRFEKNWYFIYGVGASGTIYNNKVILVPGVQVTFGRKLFAF